MQPSSGLSATVELLITLYYNNNATLTYAGLTDSNCTVRRLLNDDCYNLFIIIIRPFHAVAEGPTRAACTWTHNLQLVRSCLQLSSRYGATLHTRRHPACRCNLTPSSPVDIIVRPGGFDNATNYDRRPNFCRRGTSCMEQSSSIRHRLHIFGHI